MRRGPSRTAQVAIRLPAVSPRAIALARLRAAPAVRPRRLLAPLGLLVDARARLEALDLHHRHLVAGEALDLAHEAAVVAAEEGDGDAGASRPAGAADAVHVVLREARRVVVHHQVDARHVDAARGDVGRHQHAHAAVAQPVERAGALLLVHLAVQRAGGEALA